MRVTKIILFVSGALLALALTSAQEDSHRSTHLTINGVMTAQELQDTGVAKLNPSQRKALDDWLNRYTMRLLKVASSSGTRADCATTIEDQINGDFEGWNGDTIFKLMNGQIWEQAEYEYEYEYSFSPEVTIYPTDTGCRMKVEGMDDTILVKRIK